MPKMKADDRVVDVCAFLHRNYLVNEQWVTTGEYARFARLSNSPYLRGVFSRLLDWGVLEVQEEPYKASKKFTFRLNYKAFESEDASWLKSAIMQKVGYWQEVSPL